MTVAHVPTLHPRSRGRPARSDAAPADELVQPGVLVAIVNARGTIDGDAVGPFEREVDRSLEAGATRLLVDLSRAEDVTTRCMNTLLAARQRLFASGGTIAVVLSQRMRHRFETLDLGRRFLVADDRLHAVRLLGLGDTASPCTSAPRPHAHAA